MRTIIPSRSGKENKADDQSYSPMYSRAALTLKYLQYCLSASHARGHGVHSPFVFDFITKILNDKKHYPEYQVVETIRKQWANDQTLLAVTDFGAGSSVSNADRRSIASIARSAVKPRKFGQLLFRMCRYYQPATILELGTSLGLTSSYLGLGHPGARLVTMEGAPGVADVAGQTIKACGVSGYSIVRGNFDVTLAETIEQLPGIDFAFIDGNHRCEPTLRYFQQLLEKTNNDSILVFDDIHWSRDMETAWETIKNHPAVRCSMDLFFIGIVFFRKEFREKQHFRIRF